MTLAAKTAHVPMGLAPERARQWALARTVRDFRLSADRGRMISLPNLLRLYARRAHALALEASDRSRLLMVYASRQRAGRHLRNAGCWRK